MQTSQRSHLQTHVLWIVPCACSARGVCTLWLRASVLEEPRQAAQFVQMFPDQGEWLTTLPQKKMRLTKFTVHQLVSRLQYKAAEQRAYEEERL